jgi:Tfp pilus assembly protein PilF
MPTIPFAGICKKSRDETYQAPQDFQTKAESDRKKQDADGRQKKKLDDLAAKRRQEEQEITARKAIAMNPDYAEAYYNLGTTLDDKGLLDEAIAEFRKAIALKPDDAEAHTNFGAALYHKGLLEQAIAEYRRCHELGCRDPGWHHASAEWVHRAEELVRLDALLPAILKGEAKPASPAESLQLGQLCYYTRRYETAARFFAQSFSAEPALADDLGAGNRYNAACAAVLAGCGHGEDAKTLEGKDQDGARWRNQARDWLQADLTLWTKKLAEAKPKDRVAACKELRHWRADPDLVSVRDAGALAKFSDAERKAWLQFWTDVDALLKRAQSLSR